MRIIKEMTDIVIAIWLLMLSCLCSKRITLGIFCVLPEIKDSALTGKANNNSSFSRGWDGKPGACGGKGGQMCWWRLFSISIITTPSA